MRHDRKRAIPNPALSLSKPTPITRTHTSRSPRWRRLRWFGLGGLGAIAPTLPAQAALPQMAPWPSTPLLGLLPLDLFRRTTPLLAIAFTPQAWLQSALTWVDGLGTVGLLAFAIIYVIATVAFIPGSLLTLGAGVLFGVIQGSIVVFLAATLGATAAFLVGRYVARDWVAKRFIEGNAQFAAIDQAVSREGFKIVLLTRLSPVFPFNALNYIYGLTGVGLRDYVLASIGMLPGTILYVYIGSSFKSLADLFVNAGDRAKTPQEWVLFGVGLLVTLVVTVYVTRIARRALAEAVGDEAIS